MSLLLTLLIGCTPPDHSPPEADCDAQAPLIALATTDFTVGALAAYDLTAGCLSDQIATTSGDPALVADADRLFLLNRQGGDVIRELNPSDLTVPLWEVALADLVNPHDLIVVDDELWVTQYDQAELVRLDGVTGAEVGALDLSEYADADGIPEMDGLIRHQDRGILALQRFDQGLDWEPTPGGLLVIELSDAQVMVDLDIGLSPRVFERPSTPGSIAVLTGTYGQADGGLWFMDVDSGTLESQITEEEAGVDFGHYAEINGVGVLTATHFDAQISQASAWCFSDGNLTLATEQAVWFTDVVAGPDYAWLSVRRGWDGVGAEWGLQAIAVSSCSLHGPLIPTTLEPYSLAFFP
ncbi:MAG: hypothetical protein GWP91_01300 [Rhodobacterales bacterium]|nr:hypothetical protein [Rhodobacterales bacterium]